MSSKIEYHSPEALLFARQLIANDQQTSVESVSLEKVEEFLDSSPSAKEITKRVQKLSSETAKIDFNRSLRRKTLFW